MPIQLHRLAFTIFSLLTLASLSSLPVTAAIIEVGPTSSWCNTINSARPGDEIVLLNTANFTTPCGITAKGTASAPITIRSQSPSQRAALAYNGTTSNVIEFQGASYVIFKWMTFPGTQADVDAIRVRSGNNITIEDNTFTNIGGLCVAANDSSTQKLTVAKNVATNLKSTGFYFGCQDGIACASTDLRFEENFVDTVTTPYNPVGTGYAIQVKLNSYGVIRDNTIYRTKGPGIAVYGSNNGGAASIIEGNYVEGSVNDGGIAILGGPAIVRNNVAVGNAYGGISAQDYNGRGLQKNIWIVHNTVLNNYDSGINMQNWSSTAGNVLAFNAILPRSGTSATRPSSPAGTATGNITCGTTCFVNATTASYDLWPTTNSPLLDTAGSGPETWRPQDDFMGTTRSIAADIGAFERSASTVNHTVGGGTARPPRVSAPLSPPAAPTNLQVH
jgi:hypothetical protein